MAERGLVWLALVGVLMGAAGCGGEDSGAQSGTGGVGAGTMAMGGEGASIGGAAAGGVATGGSDPVGGGGGTGATGPGAPPPECIAPCVWALIAPCRPPRESECRIHTEGTLTVACSPDSNWGYVYDHVEDRVVFVGHDGQLCYTIEVDPVDSSSVYRDAAGVEVARISHLDPAAGTISTTCADGSPAVVGALDDPACDPWMMNCVEGTCD